MIAFCFPMIILIKETSKRFFSFFDDTKIEHAIFYLFVLLDIWVQEEGVNITANSVHPGVIMTPLMRHSSYLMRMLILLKNRNKTTQLNNMHFLSCNTILWILADFLKIFTFYIWKNVPQVCFSVILKFEYWFRIRNMLSLIIG